MKKTGFSWRGAYMILAFIVGAFFPVAARFFFPTYMVSICSHFLEAG